MEKGLDFCFFFFISFISVMEKMNTLMTTCYSNLFEGLQCVDPSTRLPEVTGMKVLVMECIQVYFVSLLFGRSVFRSVLSTTKFPQNFFLLSSLVLIFSRYL